MSLTHPNSYTEAAEALSTIRQESATLTTRAVNLIEQLRTVQNDLSNLPAKWGEVAAYVNTQSTNNPDDPAWTDAKAVKDKLVADFVQARQRLDDIMAAIDAA